MEDRRLSWKAKGLHLYIISRPNNWRIRHADLLKRAIDKHSALQSAVDELVKYRYLTITRTRMSGKITGSVWKISEKAQQEPRRLKNKGFSPYLQKPHMEKPHAVFGKYSSKHISSISSKHIYKSSSSPPKNEGEEDI